MDLILEKLMMGDDSLTEMAAGVAEMVMHAEDPAEAIAGIKGEMVNEREAMRASCSEMFATLDTNGDGFIDKAEARAQITGNYDHSKEALVTELFRRVDANGDERISIDELIGVFSAMFDQFDVILDGVLADETARRAAL